MRSRHARQRGAVTVEFLIAMMPMLMFFLWLMQYAFIVSGKLITKHAAVITARAASVILDDDPANYGQTPRGQYDGKRKEHIQAAARIVLSSLGGLVLKDVSIMQGDKPAANGAIFTRDGNGNDIPLRVRVKVRMVCRVAGNTSNIFAGTFGGPCFNPGAHGYRDFEEFATFPTQAASYDYPSKLAPDEDEDPMRHSVRRFLKDQRGAIAVLSTFMAAVLVGMTYFAIGTGDAILYRERMQDASDASSYAAAVYHARGMNIIALFNILMAAIIAVLIIFRILMVFGTILKALGFIPYIGAALAAAGNVIYNIAKPAADATQKIADKVIPMLNMAQKGVAHLMPIAAEVKAVMQAKGYKAPITFGVAISSTIIQGLPVEEDEKSRICEKAAGYVADLVTGFLPGFVKKFVVKLITGLITSFGAYFCGDSKSIDLGDIGAGIAKEQCGEKEKANKAKKACNDRRSQCQDTYNADMAVAKTPEAKTAAANNLTSCQQSGDCSKPENRPGYQATLEDGSKGPPEEGYNADFNKKECEKDEAKKINQEASQSAKGGNSAQGKPHKVKSGTENGYGAMQIYAIAFGDMKITERAKGGIDVANWGKDAGNGGGFSVGKTLGPTLGKISFARAEYYFDCSGPWAEKSCNDKENAMWQMMWRVRLRRVSSKSLIGPDIGSGVDMLARIEGFLQGEGLSSPSGLFDSFSGSACDKIPAMCSGGNGGVMGIVTGQFEGVVGGLFDSALSSYQNFGRDPSNPNSMSAAEQAVSGLNALENNAIQLNGALMGGAIGIMH
jgi:Flp pilus assembly protein TadG